MTPKRSKTVYVAYSDVENPEELTFDDVGAGPMTPTPSTDPKGTP